MSGPVTSPDDAPERGAAGDVRAAVELIPSQEAEVGVK